MKRAYKYRIYPTEEQKKFFKISFAACRWVYNYALEKIEKEYKENGNHLSAQFEVARELPILKKEEETSWLKEADSSSLINATIDLDRAFKNFFKKQCGFPKFKSCKYDNSYRTDVPNGTDVVDFKHELIKIGKAGYVKAKIHRKFNGQVKSITVSKKSYDYYEASILVDDTFTKEELREHTENGTVGIDLGVKNDSNVILSDGTKFPTIKIDKEEKRIKRLQRKLNKKREKGYKNWETTGKTKYSKKYKKEVEIKNPSKNYLKLKDKIAKLQDKIARKRSYNTHLITSYVTKNNDFDTIAIEDLNVKGMTKNHHLAKSVTNANMGEIKRQLVYKCDWTGKNLVQVDRFFASSQTCSNCGYKNEEVKKLNVRKWLCPICGAEHDRDINAAVNIKKEGHRILTEVQQ